MTLKSLKMSAALAAILAAGSAYADNHGAKVEDSANATYTEKAEDTAITADTEAPTAPVTDTGMADATTEMTVADLLGMNVVSANDEVIGEIDYVVNSLDGQAAVIGIGGFLGLGEYTVAIDVNEFEMTADEQLKLSQYTETELEALPEFDETGVESLPDDTPVEAQF
ncbi:PRC-barrel domain-containing protein [Tateyamaria sp. syn59]|uniref:PRC-barrel domain-containing protein n=1 Tax=Tateyamaria sp. syn59 TaxID=2576942 RepID=UPI0011BF9F4C|nr:PRC-barrel domain-containing protein [Tateyamaria sp. syn59]